MIVVGGIARLRPRLRARTTTVTASRCVTAATATRSSGCPRRRRRPASAGRDFRFGRTDLTLAAVPTASKACPSRPARARLGRSNPTLFEAVGIYRTESGLRLRDRDLGYALRIEQHMGGRRAVRLGLALRSEVRPIEEHGLSDRESSLAAFVLHRDFRDYYERSGRAAYVRVAPRGGPFAAMLELRDERHTSMPAGKPWSLIDNGRPWRFQPIVAEGTSRASPRGRRTRHAQRGARAFGRLVHSLPRSSGIGGALVSRVSMDTVTGQPVLDRRAADHRFHTALFDVRRYARTAPARVWRSAPWWRGRSTAARFRRSASTRSAARARCRATGRSSSTAARAGTGSTSSRTTSWSRRSSTPTTAATAWRRPAGVPGAPAAARTTSAVASRVWTWARRRRGSSFFDAGRAWNEADARNGRGAGQDDFAADAGFGLRLGRLAVLGRAVSGGAEGVNFFVRVGPRL